MVKFYTKLVEARRKRIQDVPDLIGTRDKVKEAVEADGYTFDKDGYAVKNVTTEDTEDTAKAE